MSYASDLQIAEEYRQAEAGNATLTDAEKSIRYQRRRLFAEQNNSGNVSGAGAALEALGATPGTIDEASYGTARAAFEASLAVLVADGASPTQAHVTTANTNYSTLKPHFTYRHYTAADKADVETKLATLVSDGASPTQQHVTDLNTSYTSFIGGVI